MALGKQDSLPQRLRQRGHGLDGRLLAEQALEVRVRAGARRGDPRHLRLGLVTGATCPQLVGPVFIVRVLAPHQTDDLLVGELALAGAGTRDAPEARVRTPGYVGRTSAVACDKKFNV